jgi:hypothetical protein
MPGQKRQEVVHFRILSSAAIWHCSGAGSGDPGPKTCPERPRASEKATQTNNLQEETMRRFNVHLVTEVDFEDGDEASDETVQNYQNHLRGMVQSAAQGLSLRTIKNTRVETVVIEEITGSPPMPTAM